MTMPRNDCSACLTFDFDSFSVWLHGFGFSSPTHMSKGEFAGRVAVPRILDLLASRDIKATFFIPGHSVKSWPDLVARIADEGTRSATTAIATSPRCRSSATTRNGSLNGASTLS